jgi:transposase
MPKKLFLVDGSNQAYRAYHAIQTDMRAPDGFPTRALYGFVRMLLKMFREGRPDFVAVTFDKGKGWRHERFPEYKAKRLDMPEDLRSSGPSSARSSRPSATARSWRRAPRPTISRHARAAARVGRPARLHRERRQGLLADRERQDPDPRPAARSGHRSAEVEEKWGVPPDR